jgi:hypothetical protein
MEDTQHTSSATPFPHSANDEDAALTKALLEYTLKDTINRLSKANGSGDILRCIPAIAQTRCKELLDSFHSAFVKEGLANNLLVELRSSLASGEYSKISALNSLKPPVIQLSKEALEADNGTLQGMNFNAVVEEAKKQALTKMIEIKDQEIKTLHSVCGFTSVMSRLLVLFRTAAAEPSCAPELVTLLTTPEFAKRVAQTVISVGNNAVFKITKAKDKKTEKQKTADIESTDIHSKDGQKKLRALITEAMSRREQSLRDKKLTGKGKSRAGPRQEQNQRVSKKQRRKQNKANKKVLGQSASTKKQPNKR